MNGRRLIMLLLAGACWFASTPSAALAWQVSINGIANRADRANAIAVDGRGDVVSAGTVQTSVSSWAFFVTKRSGADGHELWSASVGGGPIADDTANAVAVDQAGDIVAVGAVRSATTGSSEFTVIKFAGASGAELWRAVLSGSRSGGEALSVAVDPSGDVVTAGRVTNQGTGIDFFVAKLSGSTGSERWRATVDGSQNNDEARAVRLDSAGDVLAAGFSINAATSDDFVVAKFSGATGRELWRTVINGAANSIDLAVALAVDAEGDVAAAGVLTAGNSEEFTIVKLAGSTGAVVWSRGIGPGNARSVAVTSVGDVVAAGVLASNTGDSGFGVIKLAQASGAELWRSAINGGLGSAGVANAVAVDAADNAVVAGFLIDGQTYFTIAQLAGASGSEEWRTQITGGGFDQAFAVAAYGDGRVAAAGSVARSNQGDNFFVTAVQVQLVGKLAGRQLVLKDSAQDASKRSLTLLSQDPVAVVGRPGSASDPTLIGGTLEVLNPATGERAVMALPARQWKGIGAPAGSAGYQYADNGQTVGPCKSVTLRLGEALKASCTGGGIGFTLNEPAQHALTVTLRTGALPQCLSFGGRIVKDTPAVGNRMGEFQATNAPAPTSCTSSAP